MSIAAPKPTKYQPRVGDWVSFSSKYNESIGEIVGHSGSHKWGMNVEIHKGPSKGATICLPMNDLVYVGAEMPEGLS